MMKLVRLACGSILALGVTLRYGFGLYAWQVANRLEKVHTPRARAVASVARQTPPPPARPTDLRLPAQTIDAAASGLVSFVVKIRDLEAGQQFHFS